MMTITLFIFVGLAISAIIGFAPDETIIPKATGIIISLILLVMLANAESNSARFNSENNSCQTKIEKINKVLKGEIK
jgi:hypothetical protein